MTNCGTKGINRREFKLEVTAMVVAYKRIDKSIETIQKIKSCTPPPNEIFVSVDGGQLETYLRIKEAHPDIRVNLSTENIGPGGNRDYMIRNATYDLVASFDDDSYPINSDYFKKLADVFRRYPEASVVYSDIEEKNPDAKPFTHAEEVYTKSFVGCGCAYRKSDYCKLPGYIPIPAAYGCEESDLSIQLFAMNMKILYSPALRVYHDTDLQHHESAKNNASSLSNLVVLGYLRYPLLFQWLTLVQATRRLIYLINKKRYHGIATGLVNSVSHPYRYRKYIQRLGFSQFRDYRASPVFKVATELSCRKTKSCDGLGYKID